MLGGLGCRDPEGGPYRVKVVGILRGTLEGFLGSGWGGGIRTTPSKGPESPNLGSWTPLTKSPGAVRYG